MSTLSAFPISLITLIRGVLGLALVMAFFTVKAQEYTPTELDFRTLQVESAPLFRALKDTAGSPAIVLQKARTSVVQIVGKASPRWQVIKHQNKIYFIAERSLEPSLLEEYKKAAAKEAEQLSGLDTKNGFRTFHFGDDITQHPQMTPLDPNSKKYERSYRLANENMKIGDASLKSIIYEFYKGKLASVMIETDNLLDSRKVLAALESQYGKGYQSNKYIEKFSWFGQKVAMVYQENSVSKEATILMWDKAIQQQKAADEKQAAQKAASDL